MNPNATTRRTKSLLCLFFLLGTCTHYAQTAKMGVGVELCSSGNTHGLFVRPFFVKTAGRNLLSVGPLIQKKSGRLNGGKIAYSRNLSGPDPEGQRFNRHAYDFVQLNFTSYLQFNGQLPMCRYAIEEQKNISGEEVTDWAKVQLATAEAGVGFEIRLNINRTLSWANGVSFAVHHHTEYLKGLSRERTGCTLGLTSGLLVSIK